MADPKCGMAVECPGLTDVAMMNKRLALIDLIREITRNLLGLIAVPGILWMLYRFVEMAPDDNKMNVMLLVIGYLGGLATGMTTWYFGGAMRSAVQQALTQAKGGPPNVPEVPQIPTPVGGDDPVVFDRPTPGPGVQPKSFVRAGVHPDPSTGAKP